MHALSNLGRVKKSDILFLLVLIAGVAALSRKHGPTAPFEPSPLAIETPEKNPAVRNPVHPNKFRLAGLGLGMSKEEVEKTKGKPQQITAERGSELWVWSTPTREKYLQADFTLGMVSRVQCDGPEPFATFDRPLPGYGSYSGQIVTAIGQPTNQSAQQIYYENLPETLIFQLQDDTVQSITLEFTKSKLQKGR